MLCGSILQINLNFSGNCIFISCCAIKGVCAVENKIDNNLFGVILWQKLFLSSTQIDAKSSVSAKPIVNSGNQKI